MSKELRMMRSYLEQQNREYPLHLVEVPKEKWPNPHPSEKSTRINVWRSRWFLVQVIEENGRIRLSVNRTKLKSNGQWEDGITWDELQRLKRECGFGMLTAYEVYPPDMEIVNVANIRHLWICDVPYLWRTPASELCRTHHVQNCHICDDLRCGDNVTPEAIAARKEKAGI